MTPRRIFSSVGFIAPVTKIGMQMPLLVSPNGYRQFRRTQNSSRLQCPGSAFSPEEMKHNFATRALEKPGFFARRPYIYLCVRCRQMFLVNERRGSIVAIDRNRNPLAEPENSRQVETFSEGPCPIVKVPSKFSPPRQPSTAVKSSMVKLYLLRALVSLCPGFTRPRNRDIKDCEWLQQLQPDAAGVDCGRDRTEGAELGPCSRLRLRNFFSNRWFDEAL